MPSRDSMDALTMSLEAAEHALLNRLNAGMDVTCRVAASGRSAVINRIEPGQRPR